MDSASKRHSAPSLEHLFIEMRSSDDPFNVSKTQPRAVLAPWLFAANELGFP
jgi:hypothetical protein